MQLEDVAPAVDLNGAGAAEVDDAEFAALVEIIRLQTRGHDKRQAAAAGNGATDHGPVDLPMMEHDAARLEHPGDHKTLAQFAGSHPAIVARVSR